MLIRITVKDIEPMAKLDVELAPRLNLLTGDNGLGKTLLLDLAWWGATGEWVRQPVAPRRGEAADPQLAVHLGTTKPSQRLASFSPRNGTWGGGGAEAAVVALFAQADGGFDVCDPFRDSERYPAPMGLGTWGYSHHFHLSPAQIWDGLKGRSGAPLCNGLLLDWDIWRFQKPELFALFTRVLETLSPHPDEKLKPGRSRRVSIEDVRTIPTLAMSYGEVPVTLASSAMRRVLGIAYMLLWAWNEHGEAARLRNLKPLDEMLFLIDEVDAHLHPQWQRVILPALFQVFPLVSESLKVQILASAHAPLVLASAEPFFDEEQDQLLHFGLVNGAIVVENQGWSKQGDAVNWLVSETFGLAQARSTEAERAIEAAEQFMRGDPTPADLNTREMIDQALRKALPSHDPFWPRWLVATGVVK